MKKIYERPIAETVGVLGTNPFMGLLSNGKQLIDPENDEETENDGRANLGTAWDYNENLMLK